MVTFRLIEETDQYLIYWYFPNGNEDEWPSATTSFTIFFADHAISKIIESYNSGEILKEGMSVWY